MMIAMFKQLREDKQTNITGSPSYERNEVQIAGKIGRVKEKKTLTSANGHKEHRVEEDHRSTENWKCTLNSPCNVQVT